MKRDRGSHALSGPPGRDGAAIVDIGPVLERQRLGAFLYPLLGWCVLIMVLDGFATAVLSLAAPFIMTEWRVSGAAFGLVFGIAQMGILAGATGLGYLADRFGRRPIVLVGVVVFGAMSLLVPMSNRVSQLALIRFVAACALGGVKPVLYSLAIESAPRRMRAGVIAIVYAGVSVGQLVAGVVGGLVISAHGWRPIFEISAISSISAAFILYFKLPELVRFLCGRPGRRNDLVSQLRRADPTGTYDPSCEYKSRDDADRQGDERPFRPDQLFESALLRVTPLIWICEICSSVVTFLFYSWTPVLARNLGANATLSSYAMSVYSAGAVIGPLLLSWLIDRYGGRWLAFACAFGAIFLASLWLAPLGGIGMLAVFFVIGMLSVGIQLSLAGMFMQFYPTRIRANAVGWMILVGGLGSIGSPILFGRLIQAGVSAPRILLLSSIPMVLMLGPVLLLVQHYQHLRRDEAVTPGRADWT